LFLGAGQWNILLSPVVVAPDLALFHQGRHFHARALQIPLAVLAGNTKAQCAVTYSAHFEERRGIISFAETWMK
jgi:putative effector of murein hydrolase